MALRLQTGPTTEPVTLTEAKLHLKVDTTADDNLITDLIVAAREAAEQECGRAFLEQTWRKTLDEFPDAIELENPPILSVTSVKYIDEDGVQQTLGTASYQVDTENEPGRIVPAYGYDWPDIRDQPNAVEVIYKAGFTAVPKAIKQWILIRIGTDYANRQSVAFGNVAAVESKFADRLLDRYRVPRV